MYSLVSGSHVHAPAWAHAHHGMAVVQRQDELLEEPARIGLAQPLPARKAAPEHAKAHATAAM